jgi:hypothetical protein
MHDQVAMRLLHCLTHPGEQRELLAQVEVMVSTVAQVRRSRRFILTATVAAAMPYV